MDKTIEKEFFKAFSGGVVSLCIEYVKCLHNLLDGNYLSSVEQIPPKEWNRIYNKELQIIKPISDEFDDTVIIGVESSLIDEIEGNLSLCTTKEQQDRYLFSLLIPFAELSNILHPENNIKRSSGNDAEIQLLHTTKEVFNDIIRVKEDRLLDGIERILRRFAIIMYQFGGRLDSLLLTYGIDLFRLQNECGVYLITDRCEWYLSNYIGSTELVQKYINELPSQTQPDSPAPQLPKELDTPEAKGIFTKAVEVGLIEQQGEGFKWLDTKELLAYFCQQCSLYLNLRKGKLDKDGNKTISWKPFESLFNTKRISSGKDSWLKLHTTFHPANYQKVDSILN